MTQTTGAVLMKQDNVNGDLVLSYLSKRNPAPTWEETLRGERYWIPELNENVEVFADKAEAAECQVIFGGEPVNLEVAARLDILENQRWSELKTIRQTYPGMGACMSKWNYRVARRTVDGDDLYGIHECFYDDDGKADGWTEDPVAPVAESVEGLREELQRMLKALDEPVIEDEG